MADSTELDPEIWGPAPTHEQLAEVNEWNEQNQREDIAKVLEHCYTADNAAFLLGIRHDEVWRQMAAGEMVGLKFDTFYWVPKWQFDEDEEGNPTGVNPAVLQAKQTWGNLDEFGFCRMMLMEQPGYDDLRLNLLIDGTNESAVREVMQDMQTHGNNYM